MELRGSKSSTFPRGVVQVMVHKCTTFNLVRERILEHFFYQSYFYRILMISQQEIALNEHAILCGRCEAADNMDLDNAKGTEGRRVSSSSIICFRSEA